MFCKFNASVIFKWPHPWYIHMYVQGRIFLKIQPTTICPIELTLDENQAKTL